MKKTTKVDEELGNFSSSEPQFQSREDDEETLWEVIAIVGEKKGHYRVKWAGLDDAGKPWAPSWVAKGDVTADLVRQWKTQKKEREVVAAAARSKKSGKRNSISSTTGTRTASSSRTGSTRASGSTAKPSIRVKSSSASASGSRSVRSGLPIIVEDREVQLDGSGDDQPVFISPEHRTRHKRKRDLLGSDSSDDSLPRIVTLNKYSSPARPLKKRKVSVSEEQSNIVELANANGRVTLDGKEAGRKAIVFEESEESSEDHDVTGSASLRTTKPQTREAEKTKTNGAIAVKRARSRKDISRELIALGTEAESSGDEVHSRDSSTTSKPQTRQADKLSNTRYVKRPTQQGDSQTPGTPSNRIGSSDVLREHSKSPRRSTPDEAVTHTPGKKILTHNTILPRNGQRSYNRESQALSPTGLERLKQHDADMEAVERAGQEAGGGERAAKQAKVLEAGVWINFEELSASYYHPPDFLPLPSSSSHSPQSKEPRAAPKPDPAPPRSPFSKTKVPSKPSDDSYLQGIVPETEPEDSSGNTQSQDLSPSESQPVPTTGSHPSMLVEPPASLRSPAPAEPQISSSPPSPDLELPPVSSLEINEQFQSTSQDADMSAPLNGIEPQRESREDRSPVRGKVNGKTKAGAPARLFAKGASMGPSVDVEDHEISLEAEDLVSSIDQFSSPEKRTEAKLKSGDRRGKMKKLRMASPESDAIQKRGMELANASRQAALLSRSRVCKKSLTEIIKSRRFTHKTEGVVKTDVHLFAAQTPSSSIQDLPSSLIVPDSDRGLPDVPEEVVEEMERAYVDLNGGSNDTIEDSTSVQKYVDGRESTEVAIFALRQEEEESTQDLLQEAREAIEQAKDVIESTEAEMIAVDRVEVPGMEGITNTSNTRQSNEAQPAPMTRSDQNGQVDALLQQAQARNQELQNEIASLHRELAVAAGYNGLDKPLEQQLTEIKAAYEQDRILWNAERSSLTTAVQEVTRAKEATLKEVDFVKGLYDRASNFAASTSRENRELEERARIAEGQAKSGVAMIKATLENRVKELENHVEKWQMMASFLIQKDQRTDNDELRQRAAEHPELEAKCQSLEEEVSFLRAQLESDGEERDKMAIEAGYWKQEVERLSTMLDKSGAEVERSTQVSSYEMVYRCFWGSEENQYCDEIFQTVEELIGHLNSTGHYN